MTIAEVTLFDFDDSYAQALSGLFLEWQADAVLAPEFVVFNEELARSLGADPALLQSSDGLALLVGNSVPAGVSPIALAYAGHQFGGYSPRLGDGRALLIGEVVDTSGVRRDIHLKGSGRTPFARGGDGKATLGPMLREYLIAEGMHALGVPTTRALAVVATGEKVMREGPLPGAVLTRVAASHIRVGTFEYAARLNDPGLLRRLADYSIERHHPTDVVGGQRYLALLANVIEAQAVLIAQWMLVGFIHGVMNTDNMTISGEGIDYGPCALMDQYDPATVFSSIDHSGRYAFANQPGIALWNLARLAETLLPLIDEDDEVAATNASAMLKTFPERFRHHWEVGMRAKLGLTSTSGSDTALIEDFLSLLHSQNVDYTMSFRALASKLRGDMRGLDFLFSDADPLTEWLERWHERLTKEGAAAVAVATAMDLVNPAYIPRNHLVETALDAAVVGDLGPFHELLERVTQPYDEQAGFERFTQPASDEFGESFQTFCGT